MLTILTTMLVGVSHAATAQERLARMKRSVAIAAQVSPQVSQQGAPQGAVQPVITYLDLQAQLKAVQGERDQVQQQLQIVTGERDQARQDVIAAHQAIKAEMKAMFETARFFLHGKLPAKDLKDWLHQVEGVGTDLNDYTAWHDADVKATELEEKVAADQNATVEQKQAARDARTAADNLVAAKDAALEPVLKAKANEVRAAHLVNPNDPNSSNYGPHEA